MNADTRYRHGSDLETQLASDLAALVRKTVAYHVARRLVALKEAEGVDYKPSVPKEEIADWLGVTVRTLDRYGHDVPIPLPKALVLSLKTGDHRLLNFFAHLMGAGAVPLPKLGEAAGLAEVNAELFANMREGTEFQQAALHLSKGNQLSPQERQVIHDEGFEAITQIMRLMLLADLFDDGKINSPFFAGMQHPPRPNGGHGGN